YHQTNQKTNTGKTLKPWPILVDHYIYQAVLPDSVYEEAKQMAKDSKDKIHQYLKPEALQLVQDQLVAVTTLANGCIDYKDFEARCVQAFGKSGMQGLLVFPSNRQPSHTVTLQ
ncbi:hypothetical protein ABN357_18265, partial [Providencia rettgeri]